MEKYISDFFYQLIIGIIVTFITVYLFRKKLKKKYQKIRKKVLTFIYLKLYRDVSKKTYFIYRDKFVPQIYSEKLVKYLETRYNCECFKLNGKPFPAKVLWKNSNSYIHPNEILGTLTKSSDYLKQTPLTRCPTINNPTEYRKSRSFIKRIYELGPIKHEDDNYLMTSIDFTNPIPKINGRIGKYYDNIITQYAIEWELKKALTKINGDSYESLSVPKTLPLRESIDELREPTVDGTGRCSSITISTLVVFNRSNQGFHCFIAKRSLEVGVSLNEFHVAPSGMFVAENPSDNWSIQNNIWKELLEEIYNEKEQQGSKDKRFLDTIPQIKPIDTIEKLILEGNAHLCVTGICNDLLNLRTEICTILFIEKTDFAVSRNFKLNWEYDYKDYKYGQGLIRWENIDKFVNDVLSNYRMVVSGAVCLGLGREWLRNMYKI